MQFLRFVSFTTTDSFDFFSILLTIGCFGAGLGCSRLGKHMIGTLNTIAQAPNTRNPNHQAPIQRGSLGVMSTALKVQNII